MRIRGFSASAVQAGIKYIDRLDMGLVLSSVPAVVAGVFTKNEVKAAPVLAGMKRLASGPSHARAIVVNSGNANACTGERGLEDVMRTARLMADALGISPDDVLVSSTGVIGKPLPMDKIEAALPELARNLDEDGIDDVARAILTTDLVPKTAERSVTIGGTPVRIGGFAKGSGMIAPSMGLPHATMLAFILTDAALDPEWAKGTLARAVDRSFNKILVDGDTSTNDTVLLLANGLAGNHVVDGGTAGNVIEEALHELCQDLALQIIRDGEGATKCVNVVVNGARSDKEAEALARTIAASPLVKTAFFGEDPNWGRILAAAGRAGHPLDQTLVNLSIDGIEIVRNGLGLGDEAEKTAKAAMAKREFTITLDLGLGNGIARIVTCDLSEDYIRINASYRT